MRRFKLGAAAWLVLFTTMLVTDATYSHVLPSVPPSLLQVWDIRYAGAQLDLTFHVRTAGAYVFRLQFHSDEKTDRKRMLDFVGSGSYSYAYFTRDGEGRRQIKDDGRDGTRLEVMEKARRGELQAVVVGEGTAIPLHLRLIKLGSKETVLFDEVVERVGIASRDMEVISRDVRGWRLVEGDYRLTAWTTQPSLVPEDVRTFVAVRQGRVK